MPSLTIARLPQGLLISPSCSDASIYSPKPPRLSLSNGCTTTYILLCTSKCCAYSAQQGLCLMPPCAPCRPLPSMRCWSTWTTMDPDQQGRPAPSWSWAMQRLVLVAGGTPCCFLLSSCCLAHLLCSTCGSAVLPQSQQQSCCVDMPLFHDGLCSSRAALIRNCGLVSS